MRFHLGFHPNPHAYGSQAQSNSYLVFGTPSYSSKSPPTALPAPKLDTTTLDIRWSGLFVQHDLWVTPLSLPQAHAPALALPGSH